MNITRSKNQRDKLAVRIESFIFDFDGTLAELRIDFAEMKLRLNALAEKYSIASLPTPFLPVLEWLSWLENSIRESVGEQANGFRQQALALVTEIELEAALKGSLFSFTRPLLKSLAQKNIKTAIITRNCDAAVRMVFPDISDYCSAFFSRDHVSSPKPDPTHLLHALSFIGTNSQTAVMVGDHPLDIQTGKAAGVMTAGVCSGNTSREELLLAGADWVADDCWKLIEYLSKAGLLH